MPRTYTVYEDTGERYPKGRKKYKQIRRVIKPVSRNSAIIKGHALLEDCYNELIRNKHLEQREWRRYEAVKKVQLAYFGNIPLQQVTREKCKEYKNYRLEQ